MWSFITHSNIIELNISVTYIYGMSCYVQVEAKNQYMKKHKYYGSVKKMRK